jgi:hypothetical protein
MRALTILALAQTKAIRQASAMGNAPAPPWTRDRDGRVAGGSPSAADIEPFSATPPTIGEELPPGSIIDLITHGNALRVLENGWGKPVVG